MSFELRDYQRECVDAIHGHFQSHDRQLVQLPTGSGKTVILWQFIKESGKKALVIAPTRELTEQIFETGKRIEGRDKVHLKRKSYIPRYKHLVMTPQALTWMVKRGEAVNFDILVIDEAHRSQAKTYRCLMDEFPVPVLGLTATPERMDGKSLIDVFGKITYQKTFYDLMQSGHLCDLECWKIKTNVKIPRMEEKNGDFTSSALKMLDIDSRNELIYKIYSEKCYGLKTLVFCLNVEHAMKMATFFSERGIKSECAYGAMPSSQRRHVLESFLSGRTRVLFNVQLLTEGFDDPGIEALILARPTKSKALYCQMIGRGVRPSPVKEMCKVFEFGDAIHNTQSFNALGRLPKSFGQGQRIRSEFRRAIDHPELYLEDLEIEYERTAFFKDDESLDSPALKSQLFYLKRENIPHWEGITIREAGYLRWKDGRLKRYGFDSKEYWKKWSDFLRPRDSINLGKIPG